jgi:tRNA threonylcarbamoyladenosine biosynthesis protein TsaE
MQREIKGYWTQVSLEKLSQVTREIWELIGENSFISLSAEMGSGKTTIVRSLLKQAQIDHFEGSPTFAIVQHYISPTKHKIYHLDCYRIETENELINLGLHELFDSPGYFFVEWPEKITSLIPIPHFTLYIRIESETSREITLCYDY